MAIDFKPNFFAGSATPAAKTASAMLQISFVNDPKFRARVGAWLYENFDAFAAEYKRHGRFLTLAETEQILEQE
jgi:hypothetical protein